jgi:hypothetical protein
MNLLKICLILLPVFVEQSAEFMGMDMGMGGQGLIRGYLSVCHDTYFIRGFKEKIQVM